MSFNVKFKFVFHQDVYVTYCPSSDTATTHCVDFILDLSLTYSCEVRHEIIKNIISQNNVSESIRGDFLFNEL